MSNHMTKLKAGRFSRANLIMACLFVLFSGLFVFPSESNATKAIPDCSESDSFAMDAAMAECLERVPAALLAAEVFLVEHAATQAEERHEGEYDAIEKLRDAPEALGASYHGRRAAFEQMQEELR